MLDVEFNGELNCDRQIVTDSFLVVWLYVGSVSLKFLF